MRNAIKPLVFSLLCVGFSTCCFTHSVFAADTASNSVFSHLPPNTVLPGAANNNANTNPATPTAQTPTPNATPSITVARTPANSLSPIPPTLNVHGYFLQDAYSGKVLASFNPDQKMYPASLTKLMTVYIIFEALHEGRIHLNDPVTISSTAWRTGGSRMFAQVGTAPTIEELIQGMIVQSGNDACVAMAEYIGGTEGGFVNLMNQQAALLGMTNTHFQDCNGLPDPDHYTTPRDLAKLARALILNFPEYYHYFGEKEFKYNNITQPNRNRLLWQDPTVDGLKTGHTQEAGYCLIASAQRNGTRLISVLLGAPSDETRASYSESLLNYGFRFFESHKIYPAVTPISQARVWYGKNKQTPVGVADDLYVTVPTGQFSNVQVATTLNHQIIAPLSRGQQVGTIDVTLNNQVISSTPLVALQDNSKANLFARAWDHVIYSTTHMFHKD